MKPVEEKIDQLKKSRKGGRVFTVVFLSVFVVLLPFVAAEMMLQEFSPANESLKWLSLAVTGPLMIALYRGLKKGEEEELRGMVMNPGLLDEEIHIKYKDEAVSGISTIPITGPPYYRDVYDD